MRPLVWCNTRQVTIVKISLVNTMIERQKIVKQIKLHTGFKKKICVNEILRLNYKENIS